MLIYCYKVNSNLKAFYEHTDIYKTVPKYIYYFTLLLLHTLDIKV
jgi:hypothetical protein